MAINYGVAEIKSLRLSERLENMQRTCKTLQNPPKLTNPTGFFNATTQSDTDISSSPTPTLNPS